MDLTIGYLYGDLMNIYGDTGNITCLKKRCEWRGIKVSVRNISIGEALYTSDVSSRPDIYFFGGGQDQAQEKVAEDLKSKAKILKQEIERGIPLLAICGGYQLLGEYYLPRLASGKAGLPSKGDKLPGVGIFPAFTVAGEERMIGNIVIKVNTSTTLSEYLLSEPQANRSNSITLVGFENHSGQTSLRDGTDALGKVISGYGNNGKDETEGCVYKNAIGCYMHGSLLPKNPALADWLIKKALEVKYSKEIELKPLDDTLEEAAHQSALQKFS